MNIPELTFDQDLSTCLSGTAMDHLGMDSLLFYDTPGCAKPQVGATVGEAGQGGSTSLANEDALSDLLNLDPTFEHIHNIQDLIEIEKEGLFPEILLQPVADGPAEGEVATTSTPALGGNNTPMPNTQSQVVDQHGVDELVTIDTQGLALSDGSEIRLIKAEDGTYTPVLVAQGEEPEVLNILDAAVADAQVNEDSVAQEEASTTRSKRGPKPKNTLKAPAPAKSGGRRRCFDKGSDEYLERRARNNVAVRKSRDKAKQRQKTTEVKVHELTAENERLQKKVDMLSKELAVLKGLFLNVGAKLPAGFEEMLQQ